MQMSAAKRAGTDVLWAAGNYEVGRQLCSLKWQYNTEKLKFC